VRKLEHEAVIELGQRMMGLKLPKERLKRMV
jgi:hypothetical protein